MQPAVRRHIPDTMTSPERYLFTALIAPVVLGHPPISHFFDTNSFAETSRADHYVTSVTGFC